MTAECPRDGRPIHDMAVVCVSCGVYLERSLGDVTALSDAVPGAYTKQIRRGGHGRVDLDPDGALPLTSKVQALPYDEGVSRAVRELHARLASWVHLIAEERGLQALPANTNTSMSRWLLHHVTWLRHHWAGNEAVDEITQAVGALRGAMDVAPEEMYAGPCVARRQCSTPCDCVNLNVCHEWHEVEWKRQHDPDVCEAMQCGADLYAKPDAPIVTCQECGAFYEVAERRRFLLDSAKPLLRTLPEIERALPRLMGKTLGTSTLRQWKRRGRLIDHGIDRNGKTLYRIGDVIELMGGVDLREEAV